MRKEVLEHLARYAAILFRLGRDLACRARYMIVKARRPSWQDLRRGLTPNFVMTLLILAMLTYFIWGFDYIDRLSDRIVVNLLPAFFPPAAFYEGMRQKPGTRRFDWWHAGFAVFLGLGLLVAISDKYDFDVLGINVVVIMASAPWLVIFWMLARRKRILAIGMVPAAALLMGYWVVPAISGGLELHYFLIPLSAVSVLLALWSLLTWLLFEGVDKWPQPKHETLGPFMESLAMLFLFLPIMVLAIWIPRTFPGGEDWSVVLAAIVGVIFGSVVSEPLTRFLRSYGDLPPARVRDGGDRAEQDQNDAEQAHHDSASRIL